MILALYEFSILTKNFDDYSMYVDKSCLATLKKKKFDTRFIIIYIIIGK